jgi:hypothetical protein
MLVPSVQSKHICVGTMLCTHGSILDPSKTGRQLAACRGMMFCPAHVYRTAGANSLAAPSIARCSAGAQLSSHSQRCRSRTGHTW